MGSPRVTFDSACRRLSEKGMTLLSKFNSVHDKVNIRFSCGHEGFKILKDAFNKTDSLCGSCSRSSSAIESKASIEAYCTNEGCKLVSAGTTHDNHYGRSNDCEIIITKEDKSEEELAYDGDAQDYYYDIEC